MKLLIVATIAILCLFALAACSPAPVPEPIVRTVEVKVPVIQYRTAPASLKRTPITMPKWIFPSDAAATSCVSIDGENLYKSYVIDRETRLDVWEKSGFK